MREKLGNTGREQLTQLLNQGPVWDGDVLSKSTRNILIEPGLGVRCCFKGQQGYTAVRALPV